MARKHDFPAPEFHPRGRTLISASPDDAADPRRSGARKGGGGDRRRNVRKGGGGGGGSIGINLVLVVLVAGLMVAGWFVANQQQMLKDAEAARQAAEARLVVLEDRLRVTDEVLIDTGAETEDKINFWESEIRKLWAVSNERNKGWIEDNQKQLKAQTDDLKALKASLDKVSRAIAAQSDAVAVAGKLEPRVAELTERLDSLVSTQRDLVDKVNGARQTVASLQSGLANRVAENEQAVASMDAFRAQINGRLIDMERRLGGG